MFITTWKLEVGQIYTTYWIGVTWWRDRGVTWHVGWGLLITTLLSLWALNLVKVKIKIFACNIWLKCHVTLWAGSSHPISSRFYRRIMVSFDLRTKHSSQLSKHRKGDLKDNYTLPIKVVLHQWSRMPTWQGSKFKDIKKEASWFICVELYKLLRYYSAAKHLLTALKRT